MPKIVGNYKLLGTIGKGKFSKVKEVLELSTNKKYIMKVIRISDIKESGKEKEIKRRIDILSKMNHPGIVNVRQWMHCDSKMYIVFDYVENFIERKIEKSWPLTEKAARRYFQQLIDILNYVHNNGAVFRDLHLENVIIDSRDNLRLTDFVFSNITNQRLLRLESQDPTKSAEPYFLRYFTAPEVYEVEGYVQPSADIFSAGVMLYYMLFNKFPFDGSSPKEIEAKKKEGISDLPNRALEFTTEKYIKNLIKIMLKPNSHERPSIAEIKQNRWFKEGYKEIKGGPSKAAAEDTQTTVTYSANSVNSNAKITDEINGFELISKMTPFNLNISVNLSNPDADSPTCFSVKKNSVETIALIDKMLKGYKSTCIKSKKEREIEATIPVVSKSYEVKFIVSKIEDELTLVQVVRISGDVVGFCSLYSKIRDHLNKA